MNSVGVRVSLYSLVIDEAKGLTGDELVKARAPITGMAQNNYGFELKVSGPHVYMECGSVSGEPLLFCHGIFGSFRNFAFVGQKLSHRFRVIVPCMPVYDAPLAKCTVEDLSFYLENFINDLGLKNVHLAGNSMGGGAVLHYAIRKSESVKSLALFASSGLSFIPMRGGAMKLKDYDYVKALLSDIFFNEAPVSQAEFQDVYKVMQNKAILLRIFSFTRSTKRNFLHKEIENLDLPSIVIWGKEDTVTPPFIAEEFRQHLKGAEIHYLDDCGHVPSLEKPEETYALLKEFYNKI